MKKFKWILGFLFVLLPCLALAANTTTVNTRGTVVEITGLDADWRWSLTSETKSLTPSIRIKQVKFIPSALNDRLIIHDDGSASGAIFFDSGVISDAYDTKQDPMGGGVLVTDPFIDIAGGDCVFGTPANCRIIIILDK